MFGRCILLLPVWVALGMSADQDPAAALQEQLRAAFKHYYRGDLDAAQQQVRRVLISAKEQNQGLIEGECHRVLGQIFNGKAQYPAARVELETALAQFQKLSHRLGIGMTYDELGFSAWGMGDRQQAAAYYRQALGEYGALGKIREQASALFNLAFVTPERAEAEKLEDQALDLAVEAGDRNLQAKIWQSRGDRAFGQGDFSSAAERLEKAAALLEDGGRKPTLALVLTSLGRLQRAHGHPDRALEFYQRALKIQEEFGDALGMIQSVNMIGAAYQSMGKREQALDYFQRAVAMSRKTGSPGLVSNHLMNVANAYLEMGEFARAASLLEEQIGAEFNWKPLAYTNLSSAYTALGRHQSALDMADKAVQLTTDREKLILALRTRAQARQNLKQSDQALADIREALRLVEQIRARLVPSDLMKRGFSEQHQELYASAIELLHQSGRQAEALEAAEQARGRAFLDLLATRQETGFSLQPAREDRAESPAEAFPFTLRGGSAKVAPLAFPDVELRSAASTPATSSARIAATAARLGSTLLEYWVDKERTFLWVVQPDGEIHGERIEAGADRLRRLIGGTWAGLFAKSKRGEQEPDDEIELPVRGEDMPAFDPNQKQAWRELYRLLVQPVRQYLPMTPGARLTIVPHGPLFHLSFAALLDEKGRYLVESYSLHYAPAAALLEFTANRPRYSPRQAGRVLIVADPAGAAPLPGSRREAAAIARLWPAGATTVLMGARAREAEVRPLLEDKTVIHFATHGIVRAERPFDSFLALGGGSKEASGDGRLTAREIYDLNLTANLVTLSACRSGLGKISGDGVTGLTRGFFSAGVPSVIATLWDIADEPTVLLVSEFYRSWRKLDDKSRALRAAQLRLLRALRAGEVKATTPSGTRVLAEHPIFWAGFVLQGEPL